MPSKRSLFNKTLFGKHLSRFWPLWGGVSLVGAMVPLYLQLYLMQNVSGVIDDSDVFRAGLYGAAAYFAPVFTCIYAIFCVMAVWGYLYNARSVGLMHTLPVDRTCLFVTNTLAALAMILIPYAVTGGLICLVALCWGLFDVVAAATAVLVVLLITLLFTGIATLCAMLTGHAFVLPAFYLLANFLAFLLEMLVTNLAHVFLMGVPMLEDLGRFTFLSPVMKLYNSSFGPYTERLEDNTFASHMGGLWVPALYALAGCAMLAAGWILYNRRHSESAGDVVAFRWLRPIFRYGAALLSGLTVGRVLYALMWASFFQQGDFAEALPMGVCLFLGALLGYYAASMLLEKSLRVFHKKSLPGVGIVTVGTVVLCLLVSVDVFGLERKIPAWDEIESIDIADRGVYSGPYSTEKNPEQAEALRTFHQAIVADRDYIRSYQPDWDKEDVKAFAHYVHLTYYLKDGSVLDRTYDLWLTEERAAASGTYDSLLAAFYQDPAVRAGEVAIPEESRLDSIDVTCDYFRDGVYSINTTDEADGDLRDTRQVYEALQQDAAEGHIPARNVLSYNRGYSNSSFYLLLNYRGLDKQTNTYYGRSKHVYLSPSMTNTLDALVELGYLSVEDVARWERDLAEEEAEDLLIVAHEFAVPNPA